MYLAATVIVLLISVGLISPTSAECSLRQQIQSIQCPLIFSKFNEELEKGQGIQSMLPYCSGAVLCAGNIRDGCSRMGMSLADFQHLDSQIDLFCRVDTECHDIMTDCATKLRDLEMGRGVSAKQITCRNTQNVLACSAKLILNCAPAIGNVDQSIEELEQMRRHLADVC